MKIAVWPYAAPVYAEEIANGFAAKRQGDAGIDLRAVETVEVHAGRAVAVPLGVSIEIDSYFVGWVTGRSSSALHSSLFVHEGKIDSGYRGELHCLVTANGSPVEIAKGNRICQLLVIHVMPPTALSGSSNWTSVSFEELTETERGAAGLGSTGVS